MTDRERPPEQGSLWIGHSRRSAPDSEPEWPAPKQPPAPDDKDTQDTPSGESGPDVSWKGGKLDWTPEVARRVRSERAADRRARAQAEAEAASAAEKERARPERPGANEPEVGPERVTGTEDPSTRGAVTTGRWPFDPPHTPEPKPFPPPEPTPPPAPDAPDAPASDAASSAPSPPSSPGTTASPASQKRVPPYAAPPPPRPTEPFAPTPAAASTASASEPAEERERGWSAYGTGWFVLASAVLAVLGCMGPWVSALDGVLEVGGVRTGGGVVALALIAIAAVATFWQMTIDRGIAGAGIALGASICGVLVTLWQMRAIPDRDVVLGQTVDGASFGWGVFATLIGLILMTGAAVHLLTIVRRRRQSERGPETQGPRRTELPSYGDLSGPDPR